MKCNERDELAHVITNAYRTKAKQPPRDGHAAVDEPIAEAILASGYRKPRVITECYPQNDVESLPVGSVVLSDGIAFILNVDGTWVDKNDFVEDSRDLALPVLVLWEPTS